jgi:hypothetical protein
MDLRQSKLSKSEWESIEISVSQNEIEILQLIKEGFHNVNVRHNHNKSLFTYLKIDPSPEMEAYLYKTFFEPKVEEMNKRFKLYKQDKDKNPLHVEINSKLTIKKADKIRLESSSRQVIDKNHVFEFVLIDYIEKLYENKLINKNEWNKYYFTLFKLRNVSIVKLNSIVMSIIDKILKLYEDDISINNIIYNSANYIEHNYDLLKYNDITLYQHQKDIFTAVKGNRPKLILYIAPTGTGKTMTPIGLSENKKIIFVCAARHVGLALARSAITVGKKIAFAFGCESPKDIRLHYFAAKEFTVDKRSGSIRKVDNSVGDNVEIIICDIRSYLYSMYYMMTFNHPNNIITYWDEPTITMDYKTHDLHYIIKRNWASNLIPTVILSSATLPKLHELTETIADFKMKFDNPDIINIVSHDCKKSIPLINKNGYVVMPHYMSEDYNEILRIIKHCSDNLTILRYLDMKEVSELIHYVEENNLTKSKSKISRNFASLDDVSMQSIKIHYLKVLENINKDAWLQVYNHMIQHREKRIKSNESVDLKGNPVLRTKSIGPGSTIPVQHSGAPLSRMTSQQIVPTPEPTNNNCAIYITTKDAYTLTDGPTIFLANEVEKIAKFCIQQANIPEKLMEDILAKIDHNNNLAERISILEKQMEDEKVKSESNCGDANKTVNSKKNTKSKLTERMEEHNTTINRLKEEIEDLRNRVKNVEINDIFVPNKLAHLKKWATGLYGKNAFSSDIDETTVVSIMRLNDVEISWKLLLLLGIGLFTSHKSSAYTEIMKKLADKQRLYVIIADSDYIYGTNYQFCHGYLSKDMELTQEKIIQALGRIGRNNIQQDYSIRFRDDEQVKILFNTYASEDKPEVVNMNYLFNKKTIKFENEMYEFTEEEDEDEDEIIEDYKNLSYDDWLMKWRDYMIGK